MLNNPADSQAQITALYTQTNVQHIVASFKSLFNHFNTFERPMCSNVLKCWEILLKMRYNVLIWWYVQVYW